ncbi:transcription factor-like protein DPA isoform X1 [Raphanus sativus]|uniref:Transcription factor-like protein DPA isoform X1 n=1 Tax=Raphanus sativus TaxID=3726 RepID=A0A6J0K990_RAPSA|nr:transcription factor-like protein DPA isoform X1 [Raphanus sativus]XP_018443981.1 transcription factor-like protein DPA isoform X1 [Raphanus sativus]
MEMDLFVTPEKQRNHPSSVSLGKTPVRRRLIVDDESEVVSEKKCQSRTSGGGLRQFSVMVCQKLEAKKITTYKEVADEIISDFATIKQNAEKPLNDNEYNEKNIRRRVYDALNVFMALDIIARDKKEIRWKGLPITCKKDVEEVKSYLQMDRNKIMNSVQKKAAFLKELREKVSSLESLMSRNKEMVVKTQGPAEGFTLPFILLETNPHAVVEIEISEDMQLVHLDFNSTPFSVHDDAYILKLMQEHKLQQQQQQQNRVSSPSSTHQHSSSAHSSSSSCIASGTSGPVSWNSGIH